MTTHIFNTDHENFELILSGIKTFDFFESNIPIEVGHVIAYREESEGALTGRETAKWVQHREEGGRNGLSKSFCILGLAHLTTLPNWVEITE